MASSSSSVQGFKQAMLGIWTPEEDSKLMRLRDDGLDWSQISKEFPDRDVRDCMAHCIDCLEERSRAAPRIPKSEWTGEDDELMMMMMLSRESKSRGAPDPMSILLGSAQAPNQESMSDWTSEEDSELMQLKNDGLSWSQMSHELPNRTPLDCKVRYIACLATAMAAVPNYVQPRWSKEEKELLNMLRRDGYSWEDIASLLPQRSACACEIHYNDSRKRDEVLALTRSAPVVRTVRADADGV